MHATPNPEHLPYLLLDKAEVPSDFGIDPEDSVRVQTLQPDMCHSGLDIQKWTISNLTKKNTRDAGVKSNIESSANSTSKPDMYRSEPDIQNPTISNPTTSSTKDATLKSTTNPSPPTPPTPKQGEQTLSPLRLALARRSVKQQIFTYMDQGDKKIDIESRTGLSHNCIKWHRRLWRDECSHPRPKKLSRSLARGPRSPGSRSERALSRRPACEEQGKFMGAGRSGGEKMRRKRRAKKWSDECYVGRGMEMQGSRGEECAEMETTESG